MRNKNLAHVFTVLSFSFMFLGGIFFGTFINNKYNPYLKKIKSLKMFELEDNIYKCSKVKSD